MSYPKLISPTPVQFGKPVKAKQKEQKEKRAPEGETLSPEERARALGVPNQSIPFSIINISDKTSAETGKRPRRPRKGLGGIKKKSQGTPVTAEKVEKNQKRSKKGLVSIKNSSKSKQLGISPKNGKKKTAPKTRPKRTRGGLSAVKNSSKQVSSDTEKRIQRGRMVQGAARQDTGSNGVIPDRVIESGSRQIRGRGDRIRNRVAREVPHARVVQSGGRPEPSRTEAPVVVSEVDTEISLNEYLSMLEAKIENAIGAESITKEKMVEIGNAITDASSLVVESEASLGEVSTVQEKISQVAKSFVESKAFEKGFCELVSNEDASEVISSFEGLLKTDTKLWRDIAQLLVEYQKKRAEMLVLYIAVVKAVDIPEYQEPKVKEVLLEDVKPLRIKKEKSSKKAGRKEITSSEKAQIVEVVERKFASKVGSLVQNLKNGTMGDAEFRAGMLVIRKEILSEIASMIDQIQRS